MIPLQRPPSRANRRVARPEVLRRACGSKCWRPVEQDRAGGTVTQRQRAEVEVTFTRPSEYLRACHPPSDLLIPSLRKPESCCCGGPNTTAHRCYAVFI